MAEQPDDGLKGLRPVRALPPVGIVANVQHQDALGFMTAANFRLAVVEFDDQGRCYDRDQLDHVSTAIENLRLDGRDVILLVFVHGWQHNAASDDANLSSFRRTLDRTARHERGCAGEGAAREVFGVYVGWRGLSAHGLGEAGAAPTFWGRQEAGHRVATGSVRELFGRLRHYRNARLKRGGAPLLVIAGHSFGGMIVYSALAQSLIEAASEPAGHVVPGFADLVLLANPAIEGARYLPVHDLKAGASYRARTDAQLPVFVVVQAENDQPVGTFFPAGNLKSRIDEATIGDLERRCVTHAIGFITEFRTHRITGPSSGNPFALLPPETRTTDPFWIVAADKAVIDGHGGIWQEPFLDFLAALLFQHVNGSRMRYESDRPGPAEPSILEPARATDRPGHSQPAAPDRLADFARSIQARPFQGPVDPDRPTGLSTDD